MQVVSELEVESRVDLLPSSPVDGLIEQNMQLVGRQWVRYGSCDIGYPSHWMIKTCDMTRNRHVKCWSIPRHVGLKMMDLTWLIVQRYGMIAYSQSLDADTIGWAWYCGVKNLCCVLWHWIASWHGGGWLALYRNCFGGTGVVKCPILGILDITL